MRVQELLNWIETDCECEQQGLELLAAALEELMQADPDRVDPRVQRMAALRKSPLDFESLQQLLADWSDLSDQAEAVKLEAEFRRIASTLPSENWQTGLFDSLLDLYADYQEGVEVEAVIGAALELSDFIEESRQSYEELPIACEEITAETVLAHQLLTESFELWQTSFELACEASELKESRLWEQALKAGQQASRRLVTVQLLDARVQAAAH
ncbi:MAG: hypothetical protein J0I12_34510 [Candidatus Eremiobacteraeota bacterium]|nr:hypothetical protein [Candidatus Eremiobacteraeota bacterium]